MTPLRGLTAFMAICLAGTADAQQGLLRGGGGKPAPSGSADGVTGPTSTVTFWTDEAAFDAEHPGLAVEDWEDANNTFVGCDDPIHSATDDGLCFDEGEIRAGMLFVTDSPQVGGIAIIGPGFGGNSTNNIASNYNSPLNVHFQGGDVTAAALDVVTYFTDDPLTVSVYDTDDVFLASTSASADGEGVFLGISSTCPIGRIHLDSPEYEGCDNVRHNGSTFVQAAWPESVAQGERIDLFSASGVPDIPGVLVLTELSGTPLFFTLVFFNYRSSGVHTLGGNVPAGLSGHVAEFKTFSIDAGGAGVRSNGQFVLFL